MPKAPKPLVVENFQSGIAPSPHLGWADMRNVDIYSKPGILRIGQKTVKESTTIVVDLPKWMVRNPMNSGQVYALGDTGTVYKSTDGGQTWAVLAGNTTTAGTGQGLVIWKDYLFVCRSTLIDVYGPLSSSPSWSNGWKTIDSDGDFHPMLIGQDDILYGGAGRYVFSIAELTTFAPGTGASFNFNSRALDLPANYKIKSLAELGEKLMIGTWMGSNIYEFKIADIFPWDRTSPSFDDPIRMSENGINAMVNVDNVLHVMAGLDGELSLSNGVQSTPISHIPLYIANIEGGNILTPYPGAIMNHRNRTFFGISGGVAGMGVYSIMRTAGGNILLYENLISTGDDGTANVLTIGSLLPISRETYLIGWRNGSTFGIDLVLNTQRYTGYVAYAESALYQVGTPLNPRTFQNLEIQLVKPLATGEGVKIKYRKNLSDSFTTIVTFDFATHGGVQSLSCGASISNAEYVQVRIELTTGSSSNTTPELRRLVFS